MPAPLKEGCSRSWFSASRRTVMLSFLAVITLILHFALILLPGLIDW